jgi:hypothetical protein
MASAEQQTSTTTGGQSGQPCAACGTPLAADQRYCLNCGARRGAPRVAYGTYLANGGADPAAAASAARANDFSPLGAVLGVALLGGMLLIGVLLGRSGDESDTAPPVVTVTTEAQTTPSQETGTSVVSEWPAGTDGWTVQLATLPKSDTTSTDVEASRAELTGKGALDVSVLDSDVYPSLPPGDYVIYSGVYDSQQQATKAQRQLGSGFSDAQVVEVSAAGSSATNADEPDAGQAATEDEEK